MFTVRVCFSEPVTEMVINDDYRGTLIIVDDDGPDVPQTHDGDQDKHLLPPVPVRGAVMSMSTPLTVIVRAAAALFAVLVVAGCASSDPARAVAADELTAPPEWA